jgi:hypothetical protein
MIMIQIKHKKILMITRFLVTIAICGAMVFGAQQLLKTWKAGFVTLHPQKTLVVSIDLGQREKFSSNSQDLLMPMFLTYT